METRQERGLRIFQKERIDETPKGWIVPSQSKNGAYLVYKEGHDTKCNCPDCQIRGVKCKHQWAVEYFTHKTTDEEGNTTVKKIIKISYKQDWKAYNTAQTNEIRLFDTLLKDLVSNVEIPEQKGRGRKRLKLNETLFCAIQKVYSQLSSRRARSLYESAKNKEQIYKAPNYNSINIILNNKSINPMLHQLLTISAMPLKTVESSFAQDSSGFRTSQFNQYAIEKYNPKRQHKWIKAHILVGTKTNIVVNARITDSSKGDCPQLQPMVKEAHENGFDLKEVTADKAYSSRDNYELVESIGGTAFIPFKCNATGKAKGSPVWKRMYHYFQYNQEEFMNHYHKRSNVETAFMMIKTKFGEKIKSKNLIAQQNELMCKLIAHNIVVVIHEMFELGIKPDFCS